MTAILTLTLVAAAAPVFEFVGQPDCVALTYADGQTELSNTCEHALLLDQSVQLATAAVSFEVVQPATATTIRDLSAFTIGMNGELYRVVATVKAPSTDTAGDGLEKER